MSSQPQKRCRCTSPINPNTGRCPGNCPPAHGKRQASEGVPEPGTRARQRWERRRRAESAGAAS